MGKRKFGVSLDEEIAEAIEGPLEYGDNRSPRIEDLIESGLVLEEVAEEFDVEIPENRIERKTFLRQLFIDGGYSASE